MNKFGQLLQGYKQFRQKYVANDLMRQLHLDGQKPSALFLACSDSRVDPAVLLQADPGDIFVVRNVANIVPPYERDDAYHGTSAALEFGVCYLQIPHIVVLGHSTCSGIQALLHKESLHQDDFISNWVRLIKRPETYHDVDTCAMEGLLQSYKNLLGFPWILERIEKGLLSIHLWFLNIEAGEILVYNHEQKCFLPLNTTIDIENT